MDTIRWGIIGCGNVTEIKSGPAFRLAANSDVVAVMRRNGALAADYAARHQVSRYYDNAEALLDDPAVNAIYIATPPDSHEAYALAAIERGYPVYIEKPVGLNAAAAHRIADAVTAAGAVASVAHYRRRLPAFTCVQQLLREKRIGQVTGIDLRLWHTPLAGDGGWRMDGPISAGGAGGHFHDLAPHQIDILLYYFGQPVHCTGISSGGGKQIPHTISGQILFENDILFNGSWNFRVAETETKDECIINGTKGSIRFHFFQHFDRVTLHTGHHTQEFRFETPAHIQQYLIADVVKYFRGEQPNPSSVTEAALGMDILEKLLG
ncbi:Gfo/Idh/MocA family protein [Chitinophaga nivalis]|uniref:Gfo/Idh/MocA family oxidoreductase n=1 Tax=Chitinophaga nivalis TaxID=2991709 RepID=A0ABT3IKW8_9BACT|nr:Gfo/Idh/MocA family oxidoreductase [Chitinophaga nivalis]MCW3465700.1 Gfo/Idh/MocA family oxidoreductase [Chitinophaga nivalis]MCW3484609.1 Gfo/Idh/MocA family oxidoreductase [Chitinophaga nivalis]